LVVLLRHTVSGAGPPLLLLHSTAADSRQWDPQRAALAAHWTVITPDLRGYGGSPLPAVAYSNTADVLALLDDLGIEQTAVVGSSGGGWVALQVASTAPDRITSLVLLCADADGVEPTADVRTFAAQEDALLQAGDIEAATELNVVTLLGPEADAAACEQLRVMQDRAFRVQLAAGEDVQEEEPAVDLSRISARTTVVAGRHDLDFFGLIARHLASALPNAELIELPWAGHLPNLERPAEITELIVRSVS
jgi:pimeloyl-ACP methyl ester carboxylesterase